MPITLAQFKERAPAIFTRYLPIPSNRSKAASALASCSQDQLITVAEKTAMAEYAGDSQPNTELQYSWCQTCRHMISGQHFHCSHSSCNLPVLISGEACPEIEHCATHCSCPRCTACNQRFSQNSCSHCGRCDNCCNCRLCNSCGDLIPVRDVGRGCSSCNCCTHCDCACENRNRNREGDDDMPYRSASNGSIRNGKPLMAGNEKDRKLFNCSRLVGVEWEFNNAPRYTNIDKWINHWRAGIHDDGSCGREIVTAPMAGDHIVNSLSELEKAFIADGAEANQDCGIHVHVDAADLSWTDMFRLLKVYAHVEPILYMVGGQQRLTSTYCAPCGPQYAKALASPDPKSGILNVAYNRTDGKEYMKRRPGKKDGGRYRGLNICPWLYGRAVKAKDTTVEFRIHRNTLDSKRVIGWAKVCARLVDWAQKATEEDMRNLPKSGLRTLCQIAPDCKDWIMHRVREWRKGTNRKDGITRRIIFKEGEYSCQLANNNQ